MAKLIENEVKGIQLKEGQTVLDVDDNEYLIEKGDVLQERTGDWRLPRKQELELMYENLHRHPPRVGGFANKFYWSSSEYLSSYAWYHSFSSGRQGSNGKDYDKRVRVVRSFKSNEDFEIGQETETGYVFDIQRDIIFECKKEDEPKEMSWYEAMKQFGA